MRAPVPNGKIRSAGAAHRPWHSFYGRDLCNGHFCPSYPFLNRTEKLAHIDILDDWYLYGLCVTDIDLVKEYFRPLGDLLFLSLSNEFRTPEELREAERMIRENITALAAACQGTS